MGGWVGSAFIVPYLNLPSNKTFQFGVKDNYLTFPE